MTESASDKTEKIQRFPVGPLSTNCYLVDDRYLVDPAGMNQSLDDVLRERVDELEAILLTHTHWDHIAGIDDIRQRYPDCKILCHSEEFEMLADPSKNLSTMGGREVGYEADAAIESCNLALSEGTFEVLFTPGHSPGGVSLYWSEVESVLTGDALFKGGVGRTDLPGSDRELLDQSLKDVLMELPDETRAFPGHGPPTTIGQEKLSNPFL